MRPKTALIHIGTPKTGTTSIQSCLARAARTGSLTPVSYPLWGPRDRDHNSLALVYRPTEELGGWFRGQFPTGGGQMQRTARHYRRFILDELRSAGDTVISAEALSGFPPRSIARLRDDLESVGFRKFHVVLYIRDPADLFLSRAAHHLQVSPPNLPSSTDAASFKYDFRLAADEWESIFPGEIIVRRFPSLPGRDVVDDFLDLLEHRMGVRPPKLPNRMNSSISAEAMAILQDYRSRFWPHNDGLATPDTVALVEFLKQSTPEIPQTKPVLKERIARQIRAYHSADAAYMRTHYGVDLELGSPDASNQEPPESTHRVEEILDHVDPEIVYRLMLRLARSELQNQRHTRSIPFRFAARTYRTFLRPLGSERPGTLVRRRRKHGPSPQPPRQNPTGQ